MPSLLTKLTKLILNDIRSAIVGLVVALSLSGAIAGIFGFIGNQIKALMTIQVYLWIVIALCSLFYLLGYLRNKTKKYNINIEDCRILVAKWRNMVQDIIKTQDGSDKSLQYLLERNEFYYSLKPHLSRETISQIHRTRIFYAGLTISTPMKLILDDIERIEKEWGLI